MATQSLTHVPTNKTALRKLVDQAHAMKKRLAKAVEKTGEIAETAVHTMEVGAGAFSMGMLTGYNGKLPEMMGIPLDLGLAVAGHLAAFTGLAGRSSAHIHGFADGFFAHFATVMGTNAGLALAKKHQTAAPAPAA